MMKRFQQIRSVTVDLDTTNLLILIALVRIMCSWSWAQQNTKEKNYTCFEEIQESKTFTSNQYQKKHTEVFSNASFYK